MVKLILPEDVAAATEAFSRQLMDVKSHANMIRDRIAEIESEESDLLHRLERPDCLKKERGRIGTRMHKILMERRTYKDWLATMRPVLLFLDGDKGDKLWKGTAEYLGLARKAMADDERKMVMKAEVVR